MASTPNENNIQKKQVDDTSDNEFHDAEDIERDTLEEKFADALDLAEETEPELSADELQANKEKAESLKQQGNVAFKDGDYEKSIEIYTEALQMCPNVYKNERAILHSNRSAAYKHIGERDTAIDDSTKAIELNSSYIKAYSRRAALYEEADKLDECMADYNKIVELEPSNIEARTNVGRLQPIIAERNEKMKEEMMGKLKDLGNMFLKPFGLSTNNFQMQQDPNTGSYSVNFTQNANK